MKAINPDEAKIVIRVFDEYATGKSPRQIAADLMLDKIPSPTGSPHWLYQSIVGGAGAKRGMIHNRLYIGEYLKNRYFNVKNPSNGKTVTRKADPSDLIKVAVPHLRIMGDDLWNAAHAVRAERGRTKVGKALAVIPRRQHLLAGLLRCGACGERMIINFSDRKGRKGVRCSSAHGRQTCTHGKTYSLDKLTALAVDNMCAHLTNPEFLKERARAKAMEFAQLEKENSAARAAVQKQLDRLNVQIAKLVRVIDDDGDLPPDFVKTAKEKEIERRGLEERLRLLRAETNVTTLHPTAIATFGKSVETLHEKLKRNPEDQECRIALANIIDSVVVHPNARGEYEVSLYARLSAVIGVDLFSATAQSLQDSLQDRGLRACLHRRDCCIKPIRTTST
jgi:site-specific DNA recombinase